ncbi:hypothetical protein FACS1894187_09910 [Synergistales bacterium]|nr:hypothetical protein FACS1894187_09910 [Synergistales bacterium]
MSKHTKLKVVFSYLDHFLEVFLYVGVLVMIAVGMAQIVARYVLQASLSWSEELMRFLYVWLTLFGTPLAIRRKQFTAIEALSNLLGAKSKIFKNVLFFVTTTMQVLFFAALTYFGAQLVSRNMHNTSPAMGLSMGLAYCAMPLGGVLGLIYCFIALWDLTHGKVTHEEAMV